MHYVQAREAEHRDELVYRLYVTDSLFYVPDKKKLTLRYADMILPQEKDTRTAEEIITDITQKFGLINADEIKEKGGDDDGCIRPCSEINS